MKEVQLAKMFAKSTIGGFQTVTNATFGVFSSTAFENVTSDRYITEVSDTFDPVKKVDFMDVVDPKNIGVVAVQNKTPMDFENITQMEFMAAPAPEFM